jgi:hypothetical protein
MAKFPPGVGTDRQSIMDDLIAIVTLHMQDRETTLREPIGPNTNLITDLDCTSWDLQMVLAKVQHRYGRSPIPFERLFTSSDASMQNATIAVLSRFASEQLSMRDDRE